MGNIIKRNTATQVDADGVVRKFTESMEVIKTDVEPFFLTYSKQILSLYNLSVFNVTTKVFWKFLEFAEWNTGEVIMNINRRNEIMQVCGISKTSYYRALDELIKAGLLTKNKDVYTIDERMFWKGDRKSRKELMNAKFSMTINPIFLDPTEDINIEGDNCKD